MKKGRFAVVVLSVALMLLALPIAAQAAEVFRSQFRGQFASASFYQDDGCVFTNVYVAAGDGRVQAGPGQPEVNSAASLYIDQYDYCTATSLLSGYGFASLDAEAFQANQGLNSATLDATIWVYSWPSDESVPVDVHLTWAGAGSITRSSSHYRSTSRDFTYNTRYRATSRAAEATGTVVLDGMNLTPAPSGWAVITRDAVSTVWIDR